MIEQGKAKKILITATTSSMVLAFRTDLIKKFQDNGYEVGVVAFDDINADKIKGLGVEFYCIDNNNRSLNPFKLLSLKRDYAKIIKVFKPDVVFTFMLKPNLYATRVAKKLGVKKIFSMVEGAGDVFVNNGLKWKAIRFFVCGEYKRAFKCVNNVFFLNEDDKKEFLDRRLLKQNQAHVVHGIGVNLDKFEYKPILNHNKFLMIARMLKSKGVYEYCKCARLVKQKYPNAVFNYLGSQANVKVSDIKEYIDDGSVNYLGVTDDVRPYLEDAFFLLLPSYREGFPMSIMEAQSVGRGIITTNVVGCKDTVIEGYNGFIVDCGDFVAMAEKVIWCIENTEKAVEMTQNARKFAEENFDQVKINQQIFEIVNQ